MGYLTNLKRAGTEKTTKAGTRKAFQWAPIFTQTNQYKTKQYKSYNLNRLLEWRNLTLGFWSPLPLSIRSQDFATRWKIAQVLAQKCPPIKWCFQYNKVGPCFSSDCGMQILHMTPNHLPMRVEGKNLLDARYSTIFLKPKKGALSSQAQVGVHCPTSYWIHVLTHFRRGLFDWIHCRVTKELPLNHAVKFFFAFFFVRQRRKIPGLTRSHFTQFSSGSTCLSKVLHRWALWMSNTSNS